MKHSINNVRGTSNIGLVYAKKFKGENDAKVK